MSDSTERVSAPFPVETGRPAPAPRDAATIIVVRDGAEGLEVFMLQRHLNSDFIGGAYVFPGGGVDTQDRNPGLARRILAVDDDHRRALGDDAVPLLACAIRETFEEAGILLGRHAATGEPVALVDDPVWEKRREALNARRWSSSTARMRRASPGLRSCVSTPPPGKT